MPLRRDNNHVTKSASLILNATKHAWFVRNESKDGENLDNCRNPRREKVRIAGGVRGKTGQLKSSP